MRWDWPDGVSVGGARVIYYWQSAAGQIFLLFLYPNNVRSNLSLKELRTLRALITND